MPKRRPRRTQKPRRRQKSENRAAIYFAYPQASLCWRCMHFFLMVRAALGGLHGFLCCCWWHHHLFANSTHFPQIEEGPFGAFFPALLGPGSAPAPERARLALRTIGSPRRHARSTPSAGRCISQLASLWSSEHWRSLGPVSFGFGAASPSSHPRCLCPVP